MRIFVTGATGFIGSKVVRELLDAGHDVLGLARSDEAEATLAQAGAKAHRGDLSQHEQLAAAARSSDGIIHLAYVHDFANIAAAADFDCAAVEAMISAIEGTGKPFINTSGVAVLPGGRKGAESDDPDPQSAAKHRISSERASLEGASREVRAMAIRLAPSVHGDGDHGFVPYLNSIAREKRVAGYIGDGSNLWPAVHVRDAARLYRLAIEGGTSGKVYHGVAEEGIPFRLIAETLASHHGIPARSLSFDEATEYFSGFVGFVQLNVAASSEITKAALGWQPAEVGLLADISRPEYFAG